MTVSARSRRSREAERHAHDRFGRRRRNRNQFRLRIGRRELPVQRIESAEPRHRLRDRCRMSREIDHQRAAAQREIEIRLRERRRACKEHKSRAIEAVAFDRLNDDRLAARFGQRACRKFLIEQAKIGDAANRPCSSRDFSSAPSKDEAPAITIRVDSRSRDMDHAVRERRGGAAQNAQYATSRPTAVYVAARRSKTSSDQRQIAAPSNAIITIASDGCLRVHGRSLKL